MNDPITGATMGATPTTSISRASTLPTWIPEKRSRTMAIDSTMPDAAARPWTKRITASTSTVGATMIAADART